MKITTAYIFTLPDYMSVVAEDLFRPPDDMPHECSVAWRGYTNRQAAEYAIGMLLQDIWTRSYSSPVQPGTFDLHEVNYALSRLRDFEIELRENVAIPSDFPQEFSVTILDSTSILIRPVGESLDYAYRKYKSVSPGAVFGDRRGSNSTSQVQISKHTLRV